LTNNTNCASISNNNPVASTNILSITNTKNNNATSEASGGDISKRLMEALMNAPCSTSETIDKKPVLSQNVQNTPSSKDPNCDLKPEKEKLNQSGAKIDLSKIDTQSDFVKDLIKKINNEDCILNYDAGPIFNSIPSKTNNLETPSPITINNSANKSGNEIDNNTFQSTNNPNTDILKQERNKENTFKECEANNRVNNIHRQNQLESNPSLTATSNGKEISSTANEMGQNENIGDSQAGEGICLDRQNNCIIKDDLNGKNKNIKLSQSLNFSKNEVNKNFHSANSDFNVKNSIDNSSEKEFRTGSDLPEQESENEEDDDDCEIIEIYDTDNDEDESRRHSRPRKCRSNKRGKKKDYSNRRKSSNKESIEDINDFDNQNFKSLPKNEKGKKRCKKLSKAKSGKRKTDEVPSKNDDKLLNIAGQSTDNCSSPPDTILNLQTPTSQINRDANYINGLDNTICNNNLNTNNSVTKGLLKSSSTNSNDSSSTSDQDITKITTPISIESAKNKIHSIWTNTKFKAVDVACSNKGDIMAIGEDKKLYKYDIQNNKFEILKQEDELSNLKNIELGSEDTPFTITQNGNTYFLDSKNNWVRLPGCATDISIGKNGEIYKLGCTQRTRGYSIYHLSCSIDDENGGGENVMKNLDHYLKNYYKNLQCKWTNFPGFAKTIIVANDGLPYIISKKNNFVYKSDGTYWDAVSGIKAKDISISNENILFIAGIDGKVYEIFNDKDSEVALFDGIAAEKISTGPYSRPSIIKSCDGIVYTSSKI